MKKLLLTLLATAIALPAFAFDAPFDTKAFEMRKTPFTDNWSAIKATPEYTSEFSDIILKNSADMTDVQKLSYVNSIVNNYVKYTTDGNVDEWQTPETTIKRRKGDCEDYAILKMHLLEKMNIKSEIVVVQILSKKTDYIHAILAVTLGDETYILDNRANKVLLDSEITDYEAVYLLNEESNYILGKKIS